jgi:hypothetical protein
MSSSLATLPAPPSRVPILWLYGADAVGKSTIAWEIYTCLTSRSVPTAHIDTDYLGFCSPQFSDRARLVELNVAAMWPNFAAAGARCLIVSGIVISAAHRKRFEAAIPDGQLTLCRLRADPETIRARIVRRAQGEAGCSGRVLSASALEGLRAYGDRSVAFAAKLEAEDIADLVIDTDLGTPPELARSILERGGWYDLVDQFGGGRTR